MSTIPYLVTITNSDSPVAWAVTKDDIRQELEKLLERKPTLKELKIAISMVGELFSDWPQYLNENLKFITDRQLSEALMERYSKFR